MANSTLSTHLGWRVQLEGSCKVQTDSKPISQKRRRTRKHAPPACGGEERIPHNLPAIVDPEGLATTPAKRPQVDHGSAVVQESMPLPTCAARIPHNLPTVVDSVGVACRRTGKRAQVHHASAAVQESMV